MASSTTNGEPTPVVAQESAAAADASVHKRKRDPSESTADEHSASAHLSQTQSDILEIVQKHDTEPSFLQHAFNDSHSTAPAQKKQRQSHPGNEKKTTIAEKLQEGAYSSLAQLKSDAVLVSQEIAAAIRASEKEEGPNAGRVSVDDLKRIQRASAVEQLIKELADRETSRGRVHASTNGDVKQESGAVANGSAASQNAGGNSGTVLTLFGNAPNPKQLFSSMQRPEETRDPKVKLELPVEEIGLPNGLTATQIMPSAADAKDGRTFEEAFPPPYALPSIHPPKGHKRSAVRDTTLNWEFKDPVSRGSKRGGYTTQSLTTADWLGYGGVDPAYGSYSSQEKRKQRDRALSGGENMQTVQTKAQAEAELQKQEEALFRRAFSSFAPSSDNAKSLVPSQTKAMMWYNKIGDRRFQEVFGDDPALASDTPSAEFALDPALMEPDTKDEDFSAVIEQLDSLPDDEPAQSETDKTNPDEVLRNISELLETLASHQRIRNAIIPSTTSTSRTPISPAPTLASKIGKPDAPAEDEVNTYNKLRHEIAYLVMKLPPYAVAKLDGDQLADLGVSKLLPFEARDYQGALEEDEVAKIAKRTAAATAAATASLTRPTSSATGQHYSSSSRTPAIGQAANTRYGQNATTASRTPATAPAYQRSVSGQNTNYGTPSAAPRPSYGQPNQYSRPGATQQPGYGQANAQQQYYGGQARPAQGATNYGGYGQNYGQGTPQTQQRPSYSSSQPLQQFQQRSAQNAVAYQTNPVTQARTGSPAMQPTYQGATQQRPGYANAAAQPQAAQYGQQPASGRATPSYPSQPPTPVNGAARPQAPPGQRAASGTPQPINPSQHQQQPVAQQSAQGMTNGHALANLIPRRNAPAAMPPAPQTSPIIPSPQQTLRLCEDDEFEELAKALRNELAAEFPSSPHPLPPLPTPELRSISASPGLSNREVAKELTSGVYPCVCGRFFKSIYSRNGHKAHSKSCSSTRHED